MKKLFLLAALTAAFASPSFAQETKNLNLNVEIRKNDEMVSAYKIIFNGLPAKEKRLSLQSYVQEIKALPADSATGRHEVVMGEIESGTTLIYDKDKGMIEAIIYDTVVSGTAVVGDANIQQPRSNAYKVEFPAKPTHGMVMIAEINGFKISYSLE